MGKRLSRLMVRPVRLWLLAFAGFGLMILAWSLAMPYDGAPDEKAHIQRAAGVYTDIAPRPAAVYGGTGAMQTVPKGLLVENCWAGKPEKSVACGVISPTGDRTMVQVGTPAGRYFPLYYLLVGWPIWLKPTMGGVLVARAISAAMAAALLASAFVLVTRYSRYRMMLGGLLLTTTPVVAHLCGAINPNGLEIAAAIAMFAGGIPLLTRKDAERPPVGVVVVVAVSSILLAVLRSGGPLWLALAAGALLLPPRMAQIRSWLRCRSMQLAGLAVVGATICSSAWIVLMRSSEMMALTPKDPVRPVEAFFLETENWDEYLRQIVGVVGWLDIYGWRPAYTVWIFLAASIVIFGLVHGSWVDRWRVGVLVFGCLGVSTVAVMLRVNQYGFFNQGRYMLPMFSGAVLISSMALEQGGLAARRCRGLVRVCVGVFASVHMIIFIYAMVRYQHGLAPVRTFYRLNPLAGPWHPRVGSITVLVLEFTGVLIVSALVWRTSRRPVVGPADHRDAAGQPGDGAAGGRQNRLDDRLDAVAVGSAEGLTDGA